MATTAMFPKDGTDIGLRLILPQTTPNPKFMNIGEEL
jgi:hypothetical protein